MKSVLTPASAQGMPIAKPETTEEYVLVSLVILKCMKMKQAVVQNGK